MTHSTGMGAECWVFACFPIVVGSNPYCRFHMAITDRNSHKHWHYLYIILTVSHRFTPHHDSTRVAPNPSLILGLFFVASQDFHKRDLYKLQ
jgi:hypothetical protein